MSVTRPNLHAVPAHHPSDERLLDYASGAAAEPVALVIASHLAFCPRCRHEVGELDKIGGALLENLEPEPLSTDCRDRLLAQIERPAPPTGVVERPDVQENDADCGNVETFNADLPAPLRGYLDRPLAELPWRRRGAISEILLLPEVARHTTRLLWIRAGAAAPQHTHEGSEITVVLRGSFRDGHGHFCYGDVEEAGSDVDHRPVADEAEDCLCLTVTDAPLKLTSPLGRLINPFVNI